MFDLFDELVEVYRAMKRGGAVTFTQWLHACKRDVFTKVVNEKLLDQRHRELLRKAGGRLDENGQPLLYESEPITVDGDTEVKTGEQMTFPEFLPRFERRVKSWRRDTGALDRSYKFALENFTAEQVAEVSLIYTPRHEERGN